MKDKRYSALFHPQLPAIFPNFHEYFWLNPCSRLLGIFWYKCIVQIPLIHLIIAHFRGRCLKILKSCTLLGTLLFRDVCKEISVQLHTEFDNWYPVLQTLAFPARNWNRSKTGTRSWFQIWTRQNWTSRDIQQSAHLGGLIQHFLKTEKNGPESGQLDGM